MKKRLNILCVLVIFILVGSVAVTGYYSGVGAQVGFEGGKKLLENRENKILPNIHLVGVIPTGDNLLSDSVYNEKTQSFAPASFIQMLVSVQTGSRPLQFISSLFTLLSLCAMIAIVVLFIKFIIAINRSQIFIRRNVSRLRWIGSLLIFVFLSEVLPIAEIALSLSDSFQIKGYSIYFGDFISITSLLLGVLSFMIAEIFAIGIRMKEDQELTI